jgi:hypothetical protein
MLLFLTNEIFCKQLVKHQAHWPINNIVSEHRPAVKAKGSH